MKVFVFAILVEAVWESIKMVFEEKKFNIDRVGAIALACVFCLAYQVDLFSTVEVSAEITKLGMLGTGFIVSRGSNFVHDILEKVAE